MQGNAKSMVLSMIACLAGCLVILALIPRQGTTRLHDVDAHGVAKGVVASKKWDVALADGLNSPWRTVQATLVPGDRQHAARWRVGYQGDGSDFVAVQQNQGAGAAWIKQMTPGVNRGDTTVAGTVWHKVEMDSGQRALVRSMPLSGLETIVSGKASWQQLQDVASHLKPYSAVGSK